MGSIEMVEENAGLETDSVYYNTCCKELYLRQRGWHSCPVCDKNSSGGQSTRANPYPKQKELIRQPN